MKEAHNLSFDFPFWRGINFNFYEISVFTFPLPNKDHICM